MARTRLFRSVRNGLVVGFQTTTIPAPHCMNVACPAPSDTDDLLLALGTLPPLTEDEAFSYTPTLTGGLAPFSWALAEGSDPLPDGLVLDSDTGEINGTPTTAGETTVTVVVTDALGQTSELEIVLTVDPGV